MIDREANAVTRRGVAYSEAALLQDSRNKTEHQSVFS